MVNDNKIINLKWIGMLAALFGAVAVAWLTTLLGIKLLVIVIAAFLLLFLFIHPKATSVLGASLIVCVLCTPKISVGGISLRLDDAVAIYIGIFLLGLLFQKKLEKQPIFRQIVFYLIYCSILTGAYMFFDGLNMFYVFYFLKEIQYFLYFFFFLYICSKSEQQSDVMIRTLRLSAIVTCIWGLFQLATGKMAGFYGVGLIGESGSSQSGGAFFLITLFFLYLYEKNKQKFDGLLILVSMTLTLFTVSRTAVFALTVSVIVYFLIKLLTVRIKATSIVKGVYFIFFSSILSILVYKLLPSNRTDGIIGRFGNVSGGSETRVNKWELLMQHADLNVQLFGHGKGFAQVVTGGTTLSTDSQYIRLLLEVGFLGIILWSIVIGTIFYIAFKHFKSNKNEAIFLMLSTVGFLVMSITHEVFIVTIQASVYWILVGIMIGIIKRQPEEKAV